MTAQDGHAYIDGIDGDIAALVADVSEMRAMVAALQANVQAHSAQIMGAEESAEIDGLTTRMTTAEAKIKVLEGGTAPPSPPQPETIWITDFTKDLAGIYQQADLVGKGRDVTKYRLLGSTMADEVAALTTSQTNNYQMVRVGVGVGAKPKSPPQSQALVAELTLDMSDIPHNANGLQLSYVLSPTVRNVRVLGGRGTGSAPPVETALLALWHCGEQAVNVPGGQCLIENVELDGRLNDGITVVGSSVLMLNDAYNVTARGLKCWFAKVGFGVALWQCGGVNHFYDTDFRWCRKAINHEQPRPNAVFNYYRPNCTQQTGAGGGRPHCTFNGNLVPAAGQALPKLYIEEPLWDRTTGPFRVGVDVKVGTLGSGLYAGKPNTCRMEDVTVVVDGKTYTGHHNNTDGKVSIGPYW